MVRRTTDNNYVTILGALGWFKEIRFLLNRSLRLMKDDLNRLEIQRAERLIKRIKTAPWFRDGSIKRMSRISIERPIDDFFFELTYPFSNEARKLLEKAIKERITNPDQFLEIFAEKQLAIYSQEHKKAEARREIQRQRE